MTAHVEGRISGKVALVTGGGGNGRAACLGYVAGGAKVAVVDINESPAQKVADEIMAKGGDAKGCCG